MCSNVTPPEVLGDPLAALEAAVAAVVSQQVRGLPAEALGERLARLHRCANQIEAAVVATVAAVGERGMGERLVRQFVGSHTRLHPGAAAASVRTARVVHTHLPATAAALAAGEITGQHAAAVASVVDRMGTELADRVEPELLGLARRSDPAAVHRAGRELFHRWQPGAAEAAHRRAVERRGLWWSTKGQVTHLDGILDAESAELLGAALRPLMDPEGPDDARSVAQRRVDALLLLVRDRLADPSAPAPGGQRAALTIVVDQASLAARSGSVTLPWTGQTLPVEEARRMACDAVITPVLARALSDGTWLPLAVGRASRVATPGMLRALRVRDGGCVWPGCSRPPGWTDAHHAHHWADGGPTELANLVLLCRRHHTGVHRDDIRVEADPDRPGLFRFRERAGTTVPAQHAGDRHPTFPGLGPIRRRGRWSDPPRASGSDAA
jgi:hypothetical protein